MSVKTIQPISVTQQKHVQQVTLTYIQQASLCFKQAFAEIPVLFDLTGRACGMYCVKNEQKYIRYNPYLFAKYYENSLSDTIPHEVAHYITDIIYGLRNIRPHGSEWQMVMQHFGVEGKATGNYDLVGIPTRQHRRFDYRCGCDFYEFTTRRHNMVVFGKANYICRRCGNRLTQVGI